MGTCSDAKQTTAPGSAATMTPGPGSPSSGYWSTNDDELSDISSFNINPDHWLLNPRPETGFQPDLMPDITAMTGLEFEDQLQMEPDTEEERKLDPEPFDVGPEVDLDLRLEPELGQEQEQEPEVGSDSDVSLPTGSSLLTDSLFCDFLKSSKQHDYIFDDAGDVLSIETNRMLEDSRYSDAFHGMEFSLSDPNDTWNDSEVSLDKDTETSLSDYVDKMRFDIQNMFSEEMFEDFPRHPRQHFPVFPDRRPFLDGQLLSSTVQSSEPEVDHFSSGCASPIDDSSGTGPSSSFSSSSSPSSSSSVQLFQTSILDTDEVFDVLLCEILQQETDAVETDARPEVDSPKLVLVATPSSMKRKASDDGELPPRKLARSGSTGATQTPVIQEVTTTSTSGVDSRLAEVKTKSSHRTVNKLEDNEESAENEIDQQLAESKISGETSRSTFNGQQQDIRSASENAEITYERNPLSEMKKPDETAAAIDESKDAVQKAEVLATLLQADGGLSEPNRGSDVIFAELRKKRTSVCSSASSSSPAQRGASSLRSFLMQKHNQHQPTAGQNLLQRLLKGQTSEAEVRREMAAQWHCAPSE